MITSVTSLAERRMTTDRILHTVAAQTPSTWVCTCGTPNQKTTNPIQWCGGCGHQIAAADLNHEVTPS